MSTTNTIKYLQRLRTVTLTQLTSIDEMLLELGQTLETPAPRQRRNLKAERMQELEINDALGVWRKPAHLRKTSGK